MDFHLTKEQLLVRKMYREFAENEVKPLAAEIDEEERFPCLLYPSPSPRDSCASRMPSSA